jgi:UDP-glucose 4-epimerase
MNILVTGGAGFIGSHIVDAYIEAGHHVAIIDNLVTGRMENVNEKADFYKCDIQSPEVGDIFSKHRFQVVNHQAAQMDVRKSVQDPIFDAENNVIGFLNILQNCVASGTERVIFASSGGAIYGEQDTFPADESHKNQPYSPYGITKLVGEKYLFFYANTYGLRYTALRYANVYGPRQNPHGEAGVVAIFANMLLTGQQPIINGDGKQTRDFVYVRDVVRASVLSLGLENDVILNIGTGVETDINRIFHILNELTGARKAEEHGQSMEGEQRRSVIDYGRAQRILGWSPDYDLEMGLAETVEYFRNRS